MGDISKRISNIKAFLSIKEEDFDLFELIKDLENSYEEKVEILDKIRSFLQNFAMFKSDLHFMASVYTYIRKTIDIIEGNCADFDKILLRTTLMGVIQEYIDYVDISQKEEVFNYLTNSLSKLSLQPLIISLGLLLKPMYNDINYIKAKEEGKDVEIVYSEDSEIESLIKGVIDLWIDSQELDLNNQEYLKDQLKEEYDRLAEIYSIDVDSEVYKRLLEDIMEMLALKLTVISLMDSFSDNSYRPVPIK